MTFLFNCVYALTDLFDKFQPNHYIYICFPVLKLVYLVKYFRFALSVHLAQVSNLLLKSLLLLIMPSKLICVIALSCDISIC